MLPFRPTLAVIALLPISAWASGWSSLGGAAPSAAGMGMAYAGSTAIADDPSVVAANPAGMTHLVGTQFSLGGSWSDSVVEPRLTGVSRANAASDTASAYFYASHALSDEWSVGFAVNSPYGFETRYRGADAIALGVSDTRVRSQRMSPALAYRLSEGVSLGLAIHFEHLALDWNSPTQTYQGSGEGVGWQLGALFDLAPYMRLGVTYRSPIQHDLSGNVSGAHSSTQITTPESLTFSVWQRYTDEWEAGGEMSLTRWSQLERIAPVQENLNYRDSWRFAWGAAYQHNERAKTRFGIAVERSPMTDDNRSSRLPDSHAVWLTLGGQYKVSDKGTVDAALAWRLPSKPSVGDGEYRVAGQMLTMQYRHAY